MCNPSHGEAETGELLIGSQPRLQSETLVQKQANKQKTGYWVMSRFYRE
jgi:hypothetical protein